FTCTNGSAGTLEITWSSNISGANAFLVFGAKGGLRFNPLTYIEPGRIDPRRAVEERVLPANVEDSSTQGFGDVSQQFVDAVLAGQPVICRPSNGSQSAAECISAARMVRVRSGSKMTRSASAPGAITPLRGASPAMRAGLVATSSTRRGNEMRPLATPSA